MVQFKKGKLLIQTNLNSTDLHTINRSIITLTQEVLSGTITQQGREALSNLMMLTKELVPSENQFDNMEKKP